MTPASVVMKVREDRFHNNILPHLTFARSERPTVLLILIVSCGPFEEIDQFTNNQVECKSMEDSSESGSVAWLAHL